MEKFLQCPYNMAIKSFVPIDQFLDKLPGVLNDLEDNFSPESVDKTVAEDEQNIHGKPLIKLLNLDRLNQQTDVQSDGVFDFIEGITVKSSNGRIIFPVREPFGNYLANQFANTNIADKY